MRCRHLLTLDSTYPGGHPQGCIGVTGVVLTSVEPFCFMHTILLSFALQLLAYHCSANAFNRIVNHLKYKSCMLLLEITERSTLYIYLWLATHKRIALLRNRGFHFVPKLQTTPRLFHQPIYRHINIIYDVFRHFFKMIIDIQFTYQMKEYITCTKASKYKMK